MSVLPGEEKERKKEGREARTGEGEGWAALCLKRGRRKRGADRQEREGSGVEVRGGWLAGWRRGWVVSVERGTELG